MLEDEGEHSEEFPFVACPFCDPALGARLLMVRRREHPESFWLPQSYWRHIQEVHSLPCGRVGGDTDRLEAYIALKLDPEDEERFLLHLGECSGCHGALLNYLGIRRARAA